MFFYGESIARTKLYFLATLLSVNTGIARNETLVDTDRKLCRMAKWHF